MKGRYWGKYRAVVKDTADPKGMGCVRVECPRVLGKGLSNWALPCFPISSDVGAETPAVGDGVWIEFEHGHPNKPIYVGKWK